MGHAHGADSWRRHGAAPCSPRPWPAVRHRHQGPPGIAPAPDCVATRRAKELVVFQPATPIKHAFRTAGPPDGWREEVAVSAIGNSRVALAICAALAAPLLH